MSALTKLSTGVLVIPLVAVVLVTAIVRAEDRWRALVSAGVAVVTFVVAVPLLWILSRQSLGDLPEYVSRGREVIGGYADALALEKPERAWEYAAAAAAVTLLGFALFYALRPLRRASWVAAVVLVVLFAWLTFRHGFIRHDGHSLAFFGPVLLLTPLFAERGRALIALLCGLALGIGAMSQRSPFDALRLTTTPFVDTVTTLASGSKRVEEKGRVRVQAAYGFSPRLLAAMRGRTLHIDPFESEVAWAYPDVVWRPVPMWQPFTAYTAGLDDLNARTLASPRGPELILRERRVLDDQEQRWESPEYMVQMVCRYRERTVEGKWELLARGADRCGRDAPLGNRRARYGEPVRVPRAGRDAFVVARFTAFDESLPADIRGLLFKRHPLYAGLGGGQVRRLPRGHAGNRHLMSIPACLGWNPALLDYTIYPLVALGHAKGTLSTITPGRPLAAGEGSYTATFERIPFACPKRRRGE